MEKHGSVKDKAKQSEETLIKIRKTLGTLGFFLPLAVFLIDGIIRNNWQPNSSISHYYYTPATVVFTSTMVSLGIFLIIYKGYSPTRGRLGDNLITNFAGIFALLVAVVPTGYESGLVKAPNMHCSEGIWNVLHFTGGVGFLVFTCLMCFFQFTKTDGKKTGAELKLKQKRNSLYRLCGIMMIMGMLVALMGFIGPLKSFKPAVFWGETIAVIFFGIAWLTKGKGLKWATL